MSESSEKAQFAIDGGKVASAWTFAGLTASEIASILAAIYTSLLLGEWLWKKAIKPFLVWCEMRGNEE